MGSFLNDKGFDLYHEDSSNLLYRHRLNQEVKIHFEVDAPLKSVSPKLLRGNTSDQLPVYLLTFFFDYPERVDSVVKRDGFWYYDTKEELIGALEEQANILTRIGFDWALNRVDFDIDELLNYYAGERAKWNKEASDQEKEKLDNNIAKDLREWRARRVKPILWK